MPCRVQSPFVAILTSTPVEPAAPRALGSVSKFSGVDALLGGQSFGRDCGSTHEIDVQRYPRGRVESDLRHACLN
jgi:hypothetical protein